MLSLDEVRDRAEPLARIGLATRGVVYGLAAVLALLVAFDAGNGGEVEGQGAVEAVAGQPLGRPLLVALACGLVAYASWQVLRAVTGAGEGIDRDGWPGPAARVGDLAQAVAYGALAVTTVRVLTRRGAGPDNDQQARSLSARLLGQGWGKALVIAVGLALVGAAVGLVWWGVTRRFEAHLDAAARVPGRRWLPLLGTVGHAARGVVAGLVGVFLVQAALDHDPSDAVGIDGALRRLADGPFGTPALVLVALGLFAYGLYSLVEARWRKVLEG